MINNEPIKITIRRSEDDQLEITVPRDSDLNDWEQVFRVALKWMTFHEDLANELFRNDQE